MEPVRTSAEFKLIFDWSESVEYTTETLKKGLKLALKHMKAYKKLGFKVCNMTITYTEVF